MSESKTISQEIVAKLRLLAKQSGCSDEEAGRLSVELTTGKRTKKQAYEEIISRACSRYFETAAELEIWRRTFADQKAEIVKRKTEPTEQTTTAESAVQNYPPPTIRPLRLYWGNGKTESITDADAEFWKRASCISVGLPLWQFCGLVEMSRREEISVSHVVYRAISRYLKTRDIVRPGFEQKKPERKTRLGMFLAAVRTYLAGLFGRKRDRSR